MKSSTKILAVLAAARKVKAQEPYISAREVLPAICVLRKKGFTWREISDWFQVHKMHWSQAQLSLEYKRWEANKPTKKR